MKLFKLKQNFYFRIILILFFLIFLGISGLNLYINEKLPDEKEIKEIELQVPLKIFTADNKLIGEFGEKRRSSLKFDQIPSFFVKAILAAEDDRFFDHFGVSYGGLVRSFFRILVSGRVQGGGSTITMQVAGNYLTGREVNVYRKLKDIFLAYRLERTYTKEEIFEFYVNRIFLGNRAYGIAAASEVYYGTPISNLNLAQWAMIAALPKAPSSINPLVNPRRAITRRNWILKRMLNLGFIYKDQFNLAISAPLTASYHGLVSEVKAPYLAENIRKYMINEYGLDAYKNGYEVYTTIDSQMQNSANQALSFGLENYDKRHGFKEPKNYADLFPQDFFKISSQERFNQIYSGREVLSHDGEDLYEDQLDPIYSLLNEFISTNKRFPALVIFLDNDLHLLSGDRKVHKISLPEDLSWARAYINENRRGPKPRTFQDFLKEGDLVWISKNPLRGDLSLIQNPEVQGSLVAMDPQSGAIKALVGGYDFFLSKFDRSTQSFPLLGSNFKPFLYAAALSEGVTASSLINDAPIVFQDKSLEEKWRPRNASGRFFGPTRLREGLVHSRNLVSIRLLRDVGIEKVRDYVQIFGFPKETLQPDLSLALGTASLSPLKNATAFSLFANGGKKVEEYFIEKIIDRFGELIYKKEDKIKRVQAIDPRISFIIKDMLKDAAKRGTAKKIKELGRDDFSGKTGTTNEAESTWFTGFNSSLVATVWVGFDQPKSLGNREFGSTTALPIWLDFVNSNLDNIPKDISLPPDGLVSIRIDKKTGLRSESGSKNTVFEFYLEEFSLK